MRILHIYKSYYPDTLGGIEQIIAQLMLATGKAGCETRLFTLSHAADPEILCRPEGTVYRGRVLFELASTPLSISALSLFRKQTDWADVVHYHFPWPFADVLHLTLGKKKPSLVTYHSDVVRQRMLEVVYRPLMQRFLRSMDAVIATSPNYVRSSSALRALGESVRVIPGGVAEPLCSSEDGLRDAAWRERLGGRFFLFVGVLRYYKGIQYLLHAASGLGVPVVIVGEGPEAESLQRLAEALPHCDARFLGRVSDEDKASLMRTCYAFVFPSHLRSEAFGMSLVEASMHGRPMISCEIGTGTSFVNLDGQTGRVVAPEQPDALRHAMKDLLDKPALAEALGRAARSRFETNFTVSAMAEKYLSVYADLCSKVRLVC